MRTNYDRNWHNLIKFGLLRGQFINVYLDHVPIDAGNAQLLPLSLIRHYLSHFDWAWPHRDYPESKQIFLTPQFTRHVILLGHRVGYDCIEYGERCYLCTSCTSQNVCKRMHIERHKYRATKICYLF